MTSSESHGPAPATPWPLRCSVEVVDLIAGSSVLSVGDVLSLTLVCRRLHSACAWSWPLARQVSRSSGYILRLVKLLRSGQFDGRHLATISRAFTFENAGALRYPPYVT